VTMAGTAAASTIAASPAIAALLEGLVDYAGLFPPAALPMQDAVARYATYRAGSRRGMLGRFVVPVARLDELAMAVASLPSTARGAANGAVAGPWRLSVLAGAADAATLETFNATHVGRLAVDTVEAKAEDEPTIAALAAALGARYTVYAEIPVRQDPSALVAALARHGLRAKIRTGGVTAEAFPTTSEVLRFLAACVAAGVPFKATAGLHHPLRGEFALTYAADSPRGTMHGFLNVFLAALLLRAGVPTADVAPVLEERDGGAIRVDGDGIGWRGHRISGDVIRAARAEFAGSFGSCSFEEPVQDLTRLRLL
jgi:hypothetical protein